MLSNHLISSCLQSFPASLFQWVSSSHHVAKVWEFQLQHQSFQWTPRMDLLAVQGTLKSLLQHHSSKASILWCSAFLIVQLTHPYMTAGKTIALIRQIFVGKVMSLLFNMLSRLVITFLPRSKCLLISWLQWCSQGQKQMSSKQGHCLTLLFKREKKINGQEIEGSCTKSFD